MRVPAEDIKQVQHDINGVRYTARNGFFDMPEHHARIHLKAANMSGPNLTGVTGRGLGYRCDGCGFGSWFATCSRCGGTCVKEVGDAAPRP